ncbi:fucolectin-like [Lepisosteus oculatus]|uniref:fucolectin-like n=1 Tax=Lepisosteus oculatus TaxID=7918 RepID=UPI0035F53018
MLWALLLLTSLVPTETCERLPNAEQNVALYGRPTQSSVLELGQAINAVDGNTESDFNRGSCSSTHLQNSPWWRVDLLAEHNISPLRITNQDDDCCRGWLAGAQVLVGNHQDHNWNQLCGEISSGGQVAREFCCLGMMGRYVSVTHHNVNRILSLCEVEVFRVPVRDENCP